MWYVCTFENGNPTKIYILKNDNHTKISSFKNVKHTKILNFWIFKKQHTDDNISIGPELRDLTYIANNIFIHFTQLSTMGGWLTNL